MELYEVGAKCGHVGRHRYTEKIFVVSAENGKEAAAKVRQIPRVKHDAKDAISYVKKIDIERLQKIIDMNAEDPYFRCHNIQEQRRTCDIDVKEEETPRDYKYEKKAPERRRPRETVKRMSSAEIIKNYDDELLQ